ncbi:MAG TPA: DUF1036 domain-containing protein [Pseudonocardiaceae bacterium]|nr:DUF1036 domain-containing protein [Pseudonocardiaceae bacterium]
MGMFKHRRVMAAASAVAAAAGMMLLPATAVANPMRSADVVLGTTAGNQGSWRVCNRLNEEVNVAISYVNPRRGGFISEGWWPLRARGACATVLVRSQTSDPNNVFLRAEDTRRNAVVDGTSWRCATHDEHTIIGNQNCAGRGYEALAYRHIIINLDKIPYTTNLVGGPQGAIDDNN